MADDKGEWVDDPESEWKDDTAEGEWVDDTATTTTPEVSGDDTLGYAAALGGGALDTLTLGKTPEAIATVKAMGDPNKYRKYYVEEKIKQSQAEKSPGYTPGQVAAGFALPALSSAPLLAQTGLAMAGGAAYQANKGGGVHPVGPNEPAKEGAGVPWEDLAEGATGGLLGQLAGVGASKVVQKAPQMAKTFLKKRLKAFAELSDDLIEKYAKDPDLIDKSRPTDQIAQTIHMQLKKLNEDVMEGSRKAVEALPSKDVPTSYFVDRVDNIIRNYGRGKLPETQAIGGYFNQIKNNLNASDTISLRSLKKEILAMDREINYKRKMGQSSDPKNIAMRKLREEYDDVLKFMDKDYEKAMIPVAANKRLFEGAREYFDPDSIDSITRSLNFMGKNPKVATEYYGALKGLDGKYKSNHLVENEARIIREAFDKPITRGSKRTNLFGMIGGGIGNMIGMPWLGTVAGGMLGSEMDQSARPIAKNAIRKYLQPPKGPLSPPSFPFSINPEAGIFGGQHAPDLFGGDSGEAQAQPQNQGGDTKQVAEHFIRMKRDPEYRKKVLEGGNQSGIE